MNAPPPVPPAKKKGVSGLAVAGCGCGLLILVALIVGFIFLGQAWNDFAKNPAKSAAMFALRLNPELEVVSTDDAKNEATIKVKKTGEVYTMSFDDIAQGKIHMRDSEGKEIGIDASEAGKTGKITIKGEDGTEAVIDGSEAKQGKVTLKTKDNMVVMGEARLEDLPAWVPVYPNATAKQMGGIRSEKNGVLTGALTLGSNDQPRQVREFYEAKLKEAGYKVEAGEITADNKQTVTLQGTKEGDEHTLNVFIVGELDGQTTITLNYSGTK